MHFSCMCEKIINNFAEKKVLVRSIGHLNHNKKEIGKII